MKLEGNPDDHGIKLIRVPSDSLWTQILFCLISVIVKMPFLCLTEKLYHH